MKAHERFPAKYLSSSNLEPGKQYTIRIRGLDFELVGQEGQQERKTVLYFASRPGELQHDKMVLNQTNWAAIASIHGDDDDLWAGKLINLYRGKTKFGPKVVDCVAVGSPAGSAIDAALGSKRTIPIPQLKTVESESPAADMDDDIPF